MLVSVASCNKEEIQTPVNNEPIPQQESYSSLEWDESYHPYSDTKAGNSSAEMVVTQDVNKSLHIGAVYTGASINDLSFKRINYRLDPIDISYTFPRFYIDHIERPSPSTYFTSFQNALNSPYFSGKQVQAFEYDFKQFTSYNELKLAFGANVDIKGIFNLSDSLNYDKVKQKTGLFARVLQQNFSVIMDYPYEGNVFANDDDYYKVASKDPVYVNSITYGRMAIIAIESEYSYEALKNAFKASLSLKVVNADLNESNESKEIMDKAEIKLYVWGGAGLETMKLHEGASALSDWIMSGGEFTRENPGVPILFTANRVEDDSTFRTTF